MLVDIRAYKVTHVWSIDIVDIFFNIFLKISTTESLLLRGEGLNLRVLIRALLKTLPFLHMRSNYLIFIWILIEAIILINFKEPLQ